jgi:hypothetical protein
MPVSFPANNTHKNHMTYLYKEVYAEVFHRAFSNMYQELSNGDFERAWNNLSTIYSHHGRLRAICRLEIRKKLEKSQHNSLK